MPNADIIKRHSDGYVYKERVQLYICEYWENVQKGSYEYLNSSSKKVIAEENKKQMSFSTELTERMDDCFNSISKKFEKDISWVWPKTGVRPYPS